MKQTKQLKLAVKADPNFEFLPSGKIKCTLTNHEMLPTLENFQNYVNSKGYKRAAETQFDFTQFEPYIVQNKKDPNKLFCTLTKQVLSKKKTPVLNHVNGKRYKQVLQCINLTKIIINIMLDYLESLKKAEEDQQQEEQEEGINEEENDKFQLGEEEEKEEVVKAVKKPKKQKQKSILKNSGQEIKKKIKKTKFKE